MQSERLLTHLTAALHESPDSTALTTRLLNAVANSLDSTLAGAFLITADGRRATHVATDDRVHRVDELQVTLNQGPLLLSADGDRTIHSADLGTDQRWPVWGAAAAKQGIRSMICTRLVSHQAVVASLHVYDDAPGRFSLEDAAVCELVAHAAAIGVYASDRQNQFDQALQSRTLIGQAQGILMERFGVDDQQAFTVLKRYSQHQNVKLFEVSQMLVATRHLPDGP